MFQRDRLFHFPFRKNGGKPLFLGNIDRSRKPKNHTEPIRSDQSRGNKKFPSSLRIWSIVYLFRRKVVVCSWKTSVPLTLSIVFFSWKLPFHHVMFGSGLAPTASHWILYTDSADSGRFSPLSLTHKGLTGIKKKEPVESSNDPKPAILVYWKPEKHHPILFFIWQLFLPIIHSP